VKLISIDTGRVSWLFPLEEIAPLEPVDRVQLGLALVDRYGFKVFPTSNASAEELNKNGTKFQFGFFAFEGKRAGITELAVFNDGIVVNATSTEAAAAFIEDLMGYVRSNFRFRDFTSKVRKILVSQVVVEFDTQLAALVPLFERIGALINKETGEAYETPVFLDFGRIDFQAEKESAGATSAAPRFLIERRAGVPFSQERYYCSAGMHSDSHLRILEEIEKMLLA
jgi:hypothetical protein